MLIFVDVWRNRNCESLWVYRVCFANFFNVTPKKLLITNYFQVLQLFQVIDKQIIYFDQFSFRNGGKKMISPGAV